MKDLKTLIRLHKLQVDDRRRQLAELQALEDRLRDERQRIDAELAEEQRVAADSIVVSMTFPAYARQMRTRRENLDQSIAQTREQVAAAEDAVAAAFQELKRFELAQEDRDRRAARDSARRETQSFDEISATRFQRKRDDSE